MEYQKIRFEPLFSVIQRTKTENGIVTRLVQNKRSDGLKNGFSCFCTLKYPDKHAKNMLILPNYARAHVCVYVILIHGRYYTGVILI